MAANKKGIPQRFEELLVGWRSQLKMTQKELAQELGVTPTTVSHWECGKFRGTKVMEHAVLEWAHEKGLIDRLPKSSWKEED